MKELLLQIKQDVDASKRRGSKSLKRSKTLQYVKRYKRIVNKGLSENPEETNRLNNRGRIKQSMARNLLLRLHNFTKEVLSFMYDFDVPFASAA